MKGFSYISKIVFFLGILCGSFQVLSQSADDLSFKFDQYRKNNLQEKVYVHTDRSAYLVGEILWFKVYVLDASFHKPLELSKVVYLEILDGLNQPVVQTKVRIDKGHGSGSVYLPATLNS